MKKEGKGHRMRVVDMILEKRSGRALSEEEIRFVVDGYVAGSIPEYQISALLMAIYFKGMNPDETAALTAAMLHSGEVMDLGGIEGPFVDKHSTGGVGDKISLPLAPIAAACGVKVPMMSGRALGHTGGTLDKLESIPGYVTALDLKRFRSGLELDGFAMTGQTSAIVPADKKLYALRDVTATVESIPLITASILSKKVAEGAESLIFDVKTGSGAFMKTIEDSRALAQSLVRTGRAMGRRIVALITDMSEPLGFKVGNFLEIEETLDCLEGRGPADVMELVYRQGAWMLIAGKAAGSLEEAEARCREAVASGKALARFLANVERQGGDVEQMMKLREVRRSPFSCDLVAPRDGIVTSIDAYRVGLAGVHLGVGRNTTADAVSPEAGFIFSKKRGDRVHKGERIAILYGKNKASLEPALKLASGALVIGESTPAPSALVIDELAEL
jgi:pyrimidine-nucleoside phosphorylase